MQRSSDSDVVRFTGFELDHRLKELRRDGCKIALRRKPMALLAYLIEQRGRVISKHELLERVWPGVIVGELALTSAVRDLRRALRSGRQGDALIENRRGQGYRFTAEIERASDPEPRGTRRLLERVDEQARLKQALEDARGASRVVLVLGPPGVGKTSLAEALFQVAVRGGFSVHPARCLAGGSGPPFWPWTQVLRSIAPGLDAASPFDGGGLLHSPGITRQHARSQVATRVLERLTAATAPRVLLLDDLHWADADSLAVLELIAQSLESVPLLLLLTSREDESNAPLQRALRVLCRLPSSERVDLRDLGEASVRALLSEQDAEALPCELIREVFSASGGNPLFVVELARLHAQGRLRPALCASRSIPVPERVRDAIELHVAQRSDDCQRSLRYATLLGEEFDPEALAELMELSLERLLVAVSEAEAAAWIGEVVETPGCYRFRHRMYRLALHASFTRADLRRLQARASRMLELRASHGLACGRARNLEHPIGLPASRQARERRP